MSSDGLSVESPDSRAEWVTAQKKERKSACVCGIVASEEL
jgi:hypothetical protein